MIFCNKSAIVPKTIWYLDTDRFYLSSLVYAQEYPSDKGVQPPRGQRVWLSIDCIDQLLHARKGKDVGNSRMGRRDLN